MLAGSSHMRSILHPFSFAAVFLLAPVAMLEVQPQQTGPIHPPASTVRRIPLHREPTPPPIPPEQIVEKFTANETRFARAFDQLDYRETVLVEEFAQQGGPPTGRLQATVEMTRGPGGHRYGRLLAPPTSTLRLLRLDPEDLRAVAEIPLFPLAAEQAAQYRFTYRGTQKVDELDTFIFEVEPREETAGPKFSGVVWVDTGDLAIVKIYGRFVNASTEGGRRLPFSVYEIYRENFPGRLWLPTYIRSDDRLQQEGAELPLRLIVRLTDFTPAGAAR
jgi:hypothetical protein